MDTLTHTQTDKICTVNPLCACAPSVNHAMMLVREFCHGGAAKPTTLSLNSGVSPEFDCCPGPSETYYEQQYYSQQNLPTYSKCCSRPMVGPVEVTSLLFVCALANHPFLLYAKPCMSVL